MKAGLKQISLDFPEGPDVHLGALIRRTSSTDGAFL